MPTLEIQPLREADLPATAAYVQRARSHAVGDDDSPALGESVDDYARVIRWRTLDNPARPVELELGHAIRGEDGVLRGVHLICPFRYRWGDRRLLALGSSTFYADADVRMQAFFLFKRYLGLPGFDFYFANTCNRYSSRMWEKVGGRAAPDSDVTCMLPLRFGPLVRELVVRRGWPRLAGLAGFAGRTADLFRRRVRRSQLILEPTEELPFLADAAERSRDAALLTVDRDIPYLRWQFVDGQASLPKQALRIRDGQGSEGWVSVARLRAGVDRRLNVVAMLDWALPSALEFAAVVEAVAARFAGEADVVVFHRRPDTPLPAELRGVRQRRSQAPRSYLIPADRRQGDWEQAWVGNRADWV